jgi:antitoxin ChpS
MTVVTIRKQGGAAIMTIPSASLELLHWDVGMTVDVEVQDGALLARPASSINRKRYTLSELLKGATKENMNALNASTEWSGDGDSIGRELP